MGENYSLRPQTIKKISVLLCFNALHNAMITIRTYMNGVEAKFDCQLLENNGIQAFIADENMGSFLNVAIGGIRLMVNDADAEKATQILNQ